MEITQQLLDEIAEAVRPHLGEGAVADYIPALAAVPPHRFGMVVATPSVFSKINGCLIIGGS